MFTLPNLNYAKNALDPAMMQSLVESLFFFSQDLLLIVPAHPMQQKATR